MDWSSPFISAIRRWLVLVRDSTKSIGANTVRDLCASLGTVGTVVDGVVEVVEGKDVVDVTDV